jgi:DNA-directed RNA polymerase subunit F
MEIKQETPINIVELNSEIDKIKKRDEQVNFRVGKVIDYLGLFLKLKPAKAKELYKEIEVLDIPRLRDIHIHKLIDILPSTGEDVKLVMDSYPITITKTNCEQIAKVVKKYKE